jgi:hypothetical protein
MKKTETIQQQGETMNKTETIQQQGETMNKTETMNSRVRGWLTATLLAAGMLAGQAVQGSEPPGDAPYPELPELNWEQRSDWLNVKTGMEGIGPAAVGDGVADDTAALQAAFDKVSEKGSAFSTVYFPPGTYRITREITQIQPESQMNHRGHGRLSRIVWDGPEGGTMFLFTGASNSSHIGTVWDGQGKAARGFVHDGGNATKILFEHMAFLNFTEQGSGTTEGPRAARGYLEGSEWRNCLFVNCGKALAFWQSNDYVFTIDGCEFLDNDYGIWSERGQWYVRNSHFQRSRQADLRNNNDIHGCSARRCTSVDSRAFYERAGTVGGPFFTIQDCHVSGWTNPDYAIHSSNKEGASMLIFDSIFTNAPSENPPILLGGPTPVVHSNNSASTPALFGGSTEHVQEVPGGERGGSVSSAQQNFFTSEAAIPTKVFDAKRDFGAKGDGKGDDSVAIQRTIDAAREHGQGAVAYLPSGHYRVNRTINITGRDYYVEGAGAENGGGTVIAWGGDDLGPVFLVAEVQNVTAGNLRIGIHHNPNPVVPIRQTSTTSQASRMHYEKILCSAKAAMEIVGLAKESVVTLTCISIRKMLIDNCSSARILLNYVGCPNIHVKGAQLDRSGFLGVLASQSQFLIEDNQSLVAGDAYQEQMGRIRLGRDFPFARLHGSPTLPAGRVTLSAPKMCGFPLTDRPSTDWRHEPFEVYFTVDNYRGQLSSVMTPYFNPKEKFDPGKSAFKVVCNGEAPIDVLLMANRYGQGMKPAGSVPPVIEGGPNVTSHLLDNSYSHTSTSPAPPVPNVLHANSLSVASQALDHFRELGAHDLELNHGVVGQGQASPKTLE